MEDNSRTSTPQLQRRPPCICASHLFHTQTAYTCSQKFTRRLSQLSSGFWPLESNFSTLRQKSKVLAEEMTNALKMSYWGWYFRKGLQDLLCREKHLSTAPMEEGLTCHLKWWQHVNTGERYTKESLPGYHTAATKKPSPTWLLRT